MRSKQIIQYILLIFLLSSLTACGFRLYGRNTLPPQMNKLYFQSNNPHGELEAALKNALQTSGASFTDTAKEAPVTMNIIKTAFTHDNPNVVSSAQATVYNFAYSATFDLLNAKGKPIISQQTVTATRTVTLNPNELIDASPEVDTAREEMGREIIFKIFNVLNAKDTRQALATTVRTNESATRTAATASKK